MATVTLALLLLAASTAGAAQAATDTLYAAPAAPASGECSSPASPCSLAHAVEEANGKPVSDDVEIKLAGGVYDLSSGPTALPISFAGPSLTIEPETEGSNPILHAEGAVRVLSVEAGATVEIVGLTIENGNTTGLGGAIENRGALAVAESTLSGNTAANGGAIANFAGGNLTVEDSTFAGNAATSVGGGAIIDFGTATIERSTLVENEAPVNGGAINIQPAAAATIIGSTLSGNKSASLGGALSNLGTLYVVGSTFVGNNGTGGSAIASGNEEATFATVIIGPQEGGAACSGSSGPAFVDAGYNLDVDGSCISATTPATGSHNGTTPLGSSTYGEVLDAYLAEGLADNGGPTATIALLNTPNPFTSEPDPAFDVVPPSFELPTPVGAATTACALPDQRGYFPLAGANCAIGAFLRTVTATEVAASSAEVVQGDTVTYTASVSPLAEGGTVAFDDGIGNPASTTCPAQPVFRGEATCTVSYPDVGTYSAAATYSGDGDQNSFVGSATTVSASVTVKAKPKVEEQGSPASQAPPATTPPKVKLKISYTPNHPHAPNPKGGPRYTFRFTAKGEGVSFYCRLDQAPFKPCRSPKVYRNLERGRHVFKVKARDATGSYTPVATVKFFAGRRAAG